MHDRHPIRIFYSMAAAFGSGVLFSLVSGMGTPNPVASAITSGVGFAVFQGGFFMVMIDP